MKPLSKEFAPTEFLMPADPKKIRCIDERKIKSGVNNGVAVPGAVEGIIDSIKFLKHVDEETAWKTAIDAGIPLNGHIDEHHGTKGCGYRKLVETESATVLAVESIPAEARKQKLEHLNGEIVTLLGEHQPTEAVINHRTGTTINTASALQNGRGIFDLDVWAFPAMAEKLGVDQDAFVAHMVDVYKRTVTRLTAMTTFTEIS